MLPARRPERRPRPSSGAWEYGAYIFKSKGTRVFGHTSHILSVAARRSTRIFVRRRRRRWTTRDRCRTLRHRERNCDDRPFGTFVDNQPGAITPIGPPVELTQEAGTVAVVASGDVPRAVGVN